MEIQRMQRIIFFPWAFFVFLRKGGLIDGSGRAGKNL